MIKLRFRTQLVISQKYDLIPIKMIRLLADVKFLKEDGTFTERFEAVVDTGAPVSVLPKFLWQTLKRETLTENANISGINDKPECQLPVNIGTITGIIVDEDHNNTFPLTFLTYLMKSNKTILILGFADILEAVELHVDYQKNHANITQK